MTPPPVVNTGAIPFINCTNVTYTLDTYLAMLVVLLFGIYIIADTVFWKHEWRFVKNEPMSDVQKADKQQ